MSNIFVIASHISTPLTFAAFLAACILWLIDRSLKYRRTINDKTHILLARAVTGFIVLGLLSTAGDIYLRYEASVASVYRVRVTVVGTDHAPVENATVWSSIGGEPKKVNGGWEFDIPNANKPIDGAIAVYAKIENSSLRGNANLHLETDHSPSIIVTLEPDESEVARFFQTGR